MNKQLRNVLATAAVVVMSSFMATAQSETFTGAAGNVYYADYEAGLVMRITDEKNHYLNLTSPEEVVDTELRPYLDRLQMLAVYHDENYDMMQYGLDIVERALDVCVQKGDAYEELAEIFEAAARQYIDNYDKLIKDIEAMLAQGRASKAKNPRKASQNGLTKAAYVTTFTFDIDDKVAGLAYTEEQVKWSREYMDWFLEEAYDLEAKVDEECMEIDELADFYSNLLDKHLEHLEYIGKWIDNNGEYVTEEDIEEILSDIKYMKIDLEVEIEYIPENPMNNVQLWIEICNERMMEAYEAYVEAQDLIFEQAEEWNTLIASFSDVLFAGAYDEPFGMYNNIITNGGKLILPDYVNIDGTDYRVVGANGNIFSCVYEDVDMTGMELVMPATIRQIHNEAFAMDGIVAVYVPTPEVPNMDANCFTPDVYASATLYVEDGWVASYEAREPWKNFYEIKALSTTGVEESVADAVSVRLEGSAIVVDAPAAANVEVYNVSGKLIYAGGAATVELPARGLYIVKVGKDTVKVMH